MHNALRQFMSKNKALNKDDAAVKNQERLNEIKANINSVVETFTEIKSVRFFSSSKGEQPSLLDDLGTLNIDRGVVLSPVKLATSTEKARMGLHEEKLIAVANILESYGLLSSLNPSEVEKLISAIGKIFLLDIKK
jgi:hypothetical protein